MFGDVLDYSLDGVDMKQCFKCERTLPLEYFYRHKAMGDGRLGKCKQCTRRDVRENRRKNSEYYKAYDKSRASRPDRVAARLEYSSTERGREVHRKACRKYSRTDKGRIPGSRWRASNPEKRQAHNLVASALKSGRLVALPCERCGEKAHAHHDDYSKPLDVRWLCPLHHAERHKELRKTG
jgi:hypothetical protein